MSPVDPGTRLRHSENVVARGLGDREGGVLLHLETGAYHSVNAVGQAIWDLVDGRRTVAAIIDELRQRVSDAPPQLDDEVIAFLAGALERDLVAVVD